MNYDERFLVSLSYCLNMKPHKDNGTILFWHILYNEDPHDFAGKINEKNIFHFGMNDDGNMLQWTLGISALTWNIQKLISFIFVKFKNLEILLLINIWNVAGLGAQ